MRGWCSLVLCCLLLCARWVGAEAQYPEASPDYVLSFPADAGSHPQFRGEWWYLTGWLEDEKGKTWGFQVTFFRHRPGVEENNPSRFTARQMLFAHVSLSDPERGRLLRAEKAARAGFGLAEAREGQMDVFIDDWTLRRNGQRIQTTITTAEFHFDLELIATPPLLQGRDGFSQKSPATTFASHYYSLPQLRTEGVVELAGKRHVVKGTAWLDHEWFGTILDEQASGWDWVGLNLRDGSAVMASQMRDRRNEKYWAAGAWRDAQLNTRSFASQQIRFEPIRHWRSPRTGASYPIEVRITIGDRVLTVRPLMDDQENDARGSTGTLYWEGAVRVFDESGNDIGRGYLELTGYGERIRF